MTSPIPVSKKGLYHDLPLKCRNLLAEQIVKIKQALLCIYLLLTVYFITCLMFMVVRRPLLLCCYRVQSFAALKVDFRQNINGVFAFRMCLNGTFPWRN